ncbi:MAG: PIN domain-containing protein [Pseudonocardiaceae bacterium]
MSVMAAEFPTFVDTNVLLYAYDRNAGDKHEVAKTLLGRLWKARNGSLSTQVLQEFYVNVTRKLTDPLSREAAREAVRAYARWPVQRVGVVEIIEASHLQEQH